MKRFSQMIDSPLGEITLAGNENALCGLWFAGQKHFSLGYTLEEARLPLFDRCAEWLARYFAGEAPDPLLLPLAPQGSAFQMRIWARLLAVPYGESVTYGQLARELGNSARAVGGAVGRNPISILIPCHRVLGTDGSLTGYAGGTERKRFLLDLEGIAWH